MRVVTSRVIGATLRELPSPPERRVRANLGEPLVSEDADDVDDVFFAPPVLKHLAMDSLMQAAQGSRDAAADSLERICLGYGEQGLFYTFCAWADVALDAMHAERLPNGERNLHNRDFINVCITFAEWTNPPSAWAGEFVLARADNDHEQISDLYRMLRRMEYPHRAVMALVNFTVMAANLSEVMKP